MRFLYLIPFLLIFSCQPKVSDYTISVQHAKPVADDYFYLDRPDSGRQQTTDKNGVKFTLFNLGLVEDVLGDFDTYKLQLGFKGKKIFTSDSIYGIWFPQIDTVNKLCTICTTTDIAETEAGHDLILVNLLNGESTIVQEMNNATTGQFIHTSNGTFIIYVLDTEIIAYNIASKQKKTIAHLVYSEVDPADIQIMKVALEKGKLTIYFMHQGGNYISSQVIGDVL